MKITITAEWGDRSVEVTRERDDVLALDADRYAGLDEVLTLATSDARRACDLPRHEQAALRFLASLPHPASPITESLRNARRWVSLTDLVEHLRPVLLAGSVDSPPAQQPDTSAHQEGTPSS